MAIFAQWVNVEETTMELCIDGTTAYAVRTVDGEYQFPKGIDREKFDEWIGEGNSPIPYHGG